MAPGSSGGGGKSPWHRTLLTLGLPALLFVFVVGTGLAAVANPATASPGATSASNRSASNRSASNGSASNGPASNGPAALSGTISYAFSYSVARNCPGCHTSESLKVTMTVAGSAVSAGAESPSSYWDNPDVYRCALAAAAGGNCFWVPLTVESASAHYSFAAHVDLPHGCRADVSATGTYKAASTPLPLGLDVVFNPGRPGRASSVHPGPSPAPASGPSGLPPAESYRATGDVALLMSMTYTNRAAAYPCGIKLPSNLWDIPIGLIGPYRQGQKSIDGATHYEGLGPPRLSWDLKLKPTGLEISSPVAGSMIALTDGDYLSPQPGPDQSAPSRRYLTVKGADTSPGASVVTVGNVSTHIASDGTWSLRVPVTRTGKAALTADDNVGATDAEEITLIDLVITSPAEHAALPISAAPAMPRLGAVAGIEGYAGNVSPIIFNWSLSTRGQYRDRCGHNRAALCGQWYPYDSNVGSGTTTGSNPWEGDFTAIVGGFGRLSVSAIVPGVLDEPVQSEPRWIDIPGTNPSVAAIKAYVSKQDPANASIEDKIFCHESRFTQFNPSPDPREPATTTVPHDIGQNPAALQPLFGAQYAGIGIAQTDPSSFPVQQWDWRANVDAGTDVYQADLAGAEAWRQDELARLSGQLTAVLKVVNHQRTGRGMKPLDMVPHKIPALSPAEIEREAVRSYNGENEYYFNLQYVVSHNHLSVTALGTGKWVQGPGEWEDMSDWQAAGGPLVARKWIPAQNPGYVQLVEACNL
jgi:hypothetical protein